MQQLRDLPITSAQIHAELQAITARMNEKIRAANTFPEALRSQIDMSMFDDVDYLLRYIMALHKLIEDVYIDTTSEKFELN